MAFLRLYAEPAGFFIDGRRLADAETCEVEVDAEYARLRVDSCIPADGFEWDAKVGDAVEATVLFARRLLMVRAEVVGVGIGSRPGSSYQIVRLIGPRADWVRA